MTYSPAPPFRELLTAHECNEIVPDLQHYDSTVDNLEAIYHASPQLRCWNLERIDPEDVDRSQQIDDPSDDEGHMKVERIRRAMADGERMPPVIIIHHPTAKTEPYALIEGRHRYNAALQDRTSMPAWVAHIGCCGGPPADLLG